MSRLSQQVTQNGETVLIESFGYRNTAQGTTGQIASHSVTGVLSGYSALFTYEYDDNGNILSVSDGTYTTSYVYDSANQLIRENNQKAGKTWTWTYDNAGNIKVKGEYAYVTDSLGTATDIIVYTYGDSEWGDLLTVYDSVRRQYDTIGNLIGDGTWIYTWEHGRQLASMTTIPLI